MCCHSSALLHELWKLFLISPNRTSMKKQRITGLMLIFIPMLTGMTPANKHNNLYKIAIWHGLHNELYDTSGHKDVGRKIDLRKEAKLTASHHTTEWVIGNAIDGNPNTQWIGEDQPLSWQPTN